MFTGIVEHLGKVIDVAPLDFSESGGKGFSITIGEAAEILGDCHLGDSIAVNGTCLTVTEFNESSFKVGVAPETLRKTNLGSLKIGDAVNLERAMNAHTRFGGHMVQGHVDTTVSIVSRVDDGNAITFVFQVPEEYQELMNYIVPKGFICLDGTSLTVIDVDDVKRTFSIMMIAYTQTRVVMPHKALGDQVNIEVDMMGKYASKAVDSMVKRYLNGEEGESLVAKIIDRVLAKRASAN
ncbi:Riboflavin synthase alpha chain [Lobosporangium transversale]|uniref:Riboflavin synthase n=1 Tax=Lobosporangium transversale TaxID=64571 RepID=A0A1Y2GFF4_9FUNG|nr:alpha subunit of riboflavin synthase [Lobosporangium transversale]KAF9917841.1 Riboflavin synthase alpha chain [Lobosporangium transversale]ORZ08005.1 alpha subunit of riboflavin synthase [Lobosporangium transversale]|eukprot:XP_021878239.1 alpha subunit of riboflavin synthase [Lobosporangium transversale]